MYHQFYYGYHLTHLLLFWQTDEDVDWTGIKHHVSEAIAKFFESGDPITTGVVYNESSAYAIIHISHLCCMQFFFWKNPQFNYLQVTVKMMMTLFQ